MEAKAKGGVQGRDAGIEAKLAVSDTKDFDGVRSNVRGSSKHRMASAESTATGNVIV